MKALADLLEDFGIGAGSAGTIIQMNEDECEAMRLDSFEQGYKAGWDDAIKTQSEDQSRISSDLAQNLQDLSFTYHEAYSQVVEGMAPLLNDMIESLLPTLARDALGLHILELLQDMTLKQPSQSVEIVVAPGNRAAIAPLLNKDFKMPVELTDDPQLAEGQADIRFGQIERRVDLTAVLNNIQEALQGFMQDNRKEVVNG
ncbi:ABC transporter ATP-binding protein [Primorskyibacter marinus]|uniref:ABC transporter ATP-binding protein n=1 Tax=Primorskyibacter marinus TaxID=1977320 RepID=UPI000E301731|nr:ABC transporter ATP-binding protein [Primorskyibacter marinus]